MRERRFSVVLALLIALGMIFHGSAEAQSPQPGLVVAIEPCALTYTASLTADVPLGLHARGYCGIPENALALFLHLKAGGSTIAGKVYMWPHGEPLPSYTQFNYVPNHTPGWPWSGHTLVRLRDLSVPGYYDIWAQSTSNIAFSVVVEGYTVPMPVPGGGIIEE